MLDNSILFTFFNLIFQVYQSVNGDNSEFNTAVNILNTLESEGKSFCLESNNYIYPSDINAIARMLIKIKNLNNPSVSTNELIEARKIVTDYSRLIRERNNVLNFVNEMIESECHITSVEIKNNKNAVIEKLKEKKSILRVNDCGEYLAIACTTSKFIEELTYLDTNTKNEVQSLVDVIVYNNQKITRLTENNHKIKDVDLVNMTLKFVEKHSSSKLILASNIVSCLILKSIGSYRRNEMKLIDDTYKTIMFNGLRINETCAISSLGSRISELIDAINSSNINLNLTNSHIIALLDGFESLSRIIQPLNILFLFDIRNDFKKYISDTSCEFNMEGFRSSFIRVVGELKYNTYSSHHISDVGEIVGIFCRYAYVNKHPILMEPFMTMKLPTLINVYIHLIQILSPITDNFVDTTFEIIERESEYIRKNVIESYVYRETITCYLRQYKEISDEDFHPYLSVFGDYLFNQYTFIFCPNRLSNLHHFAKSLSKLLPNFNGTEIFSFNTIESSIRIKELAMSSIDEDVTWIRWYQYDTCFIDESKYNYHDIKMGVESALPNTLNEIMSKILQRCSMIESTSNLIKLFNKPIEVPSVQLHKILLDVKILKSLLTSNNNEEIWHLIETETDKKLNDLNLKKGEKMRLYCEVKSLMSSFPDLSPDFLIEINFHILNLNMNTTSCLYNFGTFKLENIDQIISEIQFHQSFKNVNKDIIRDFTLLYYPNFVKNISDIVVSYSVKDSLLNIINSSTCSLDYVGDIKAVLTTNIKNKFKNIKNNWYPYFTFYKCIELHQILPLLYTLERNRRLSSSDVEIINQMYQEVIGEKPELAFETEQNIDNIIMEMRNNDKFIHFNNELKILLLSCHTLKIHSQMRDKSKDTTFNPSEATTTTSLSSEQSGITTLSTKLTFTPSGETITNSTIQIFTTSNQSIITLSSTDKSTEEALISTKETITTEISTEKLKSTNAIDELPITTVTIDMPIYESVSTTQIGSTSSASLGDINETKQSSLSTAAIIGTAFGVIIVLSILVYAFICYLRYKKNNKVRIITF